MRTAASFILINLVAGLLAVPALCDDTDTSAPKGGDSVQGELSDDRDRPKTVTGKVGVAAKYNSNIELASGVPVENPDMDEEVEGAMITEVTGLIRFASFWASPWYLEAEIFGLADIHVQNPDDSWVIGKGNLNLGYESGAHSFGLLNEFKYFSEPDDTDFDNLRNLASLVYGHAFSGFTQMRIRYENVVKHYVADDLLTFLANGLFVEIRNTWRPAFSTYYTYGFHYNSGSYRTTVYDDAFQVVDEYSSDLLGIRYSGEIGFESFFGGKNTLIGSYTFQLDTNTDRDVWQVGVIQGEDNNLENDVEFNFMKHRAMVLCSHRFNRRFTLSIYNELIYKPFLDRAGYAETEQRERRDLLYLGSTWLSVRLVGELYAKTRYLFRMNNSSVPVEDFQDHIVSAGLEFRF